MDEWVIIRYPQQRSVFVDGQRQGDTSRLLRVVTGRHTFDLGTPVDYTPAQQTVNVIGTTAEDPLILTFVPARTE